MINVGYIEIFKLTKEEIEILWNEFSNNEKKRHIKSYINNNKYNDDLCWLFRKNSDHNDIYIDTYCSKVYYEGRGYKRLTLDEIGSVIPLIREIKKTYGTYAIEINYD
jgi:hypothetical protein